ncbi:MAG TPA: RNA helicase, partial [Methylophaga sp.]|nr:RNA helicase [Methylophaga sp.]
AQSTDEQLETPQPRIKAERNPDPRHKNKTRGDNSHNNRPRGGKRNNGPKKPVTSDANQ